MRTRTRRLAAATATVLLALGASVASAAQDAPTFVRSFGTAGAGDGQFQGVLDVDVDAAGNVYATDYLNDRVQVFDASGAFLRSFGSDGTLLGQMKFPGGVEVFHDTTVGRERVLVTEFGGARAQLFELSGTPVRTLASVAGATPPELAFPGSVTSSARAGLLAIGDDNNDRVLLLDHDLTLVRELEVASDPHGVAFSPDGSVLYVYVSIDEIEVRDVATGALLDTLPLDAPLAASGYHLHADALGYLYTTATTDDWVAKIAPSGEVQWRMDQNGPGPGQFAGPYGARPTADGLLLVADSGNSRVQVLDLCPSDFSDVPGSHPFWFAICWMATANVSTGYPDGTYRPTAPVTRLAMAPFLYRFLDEPTFVDPLDASFSDVPAGSPFFHEVEWMAAEGIAGGFPDGTFRPGAAVSRQAMAAFMHRAAGEPTFVPPVTASFSDVPTSHPFYAQIEWMAASGISTGYADGTFKPGASVSRMAMSSFLARLGLMV